MIRFTETGEWLFDAECFTHNHELRTVFSGKAVSSDDIDVLYGILQEHGTVAYMETYKKPKKLPFRVMDETVYSVCLSFSDGSQYNADTVGTAQKSLEEFFYRLAQDAE